MPFPKRPKTFQSMEHGVCQLEATYQDDVFHRNFMKKCLELILPYTYNST